VAQAVTGYSSSSSRQVHDTRTSSPPQKKLIVLEFHCNRNIPYTGTRCWAVAVNDSRSYRMQHADKCLKNSLLCDFCFNDIQYSLWSQRLESRPVIAVNNASSLAYRRWCKSETQTGHRTEPLNQAFINCWQTSKHVSVISLGLRIQFKDIIIRLFFMWFISRNSAVGSSVRNRMGVGSIWWVVS